MDRRRYQVKIVDNHLEGLIDGGHNLFGIILFVCEKLAGQADYTKKQNLRKINAPLLISWYFFERHQAEIMKKLREPEFAHIADIEIAVEFMAPIDKKSMTQLEFREIVEDVSVTRNSSTSVNNYALAMHQGVFEEFKEFLSEEITCNVEWKIGEGVDTKAANAARKHLTPPEIVIIAMPILSAAIQTLVDRILIMLNCYSTKPLRRLPANSTQNALQQYISTSASLSILVSERNPTTAIYEIHNPLIKSALKLGAEAVEYADYIYECLPRAILRINDPTTLPARERLFKWFDETGALTSEALDEDNEPLEEISTLKDAPRLPFSRKSTEDLDHDFPRVLIMPYVYALGALAKDEGDNMVWAKANVKDAIDECIRKTIVKSHPQSFIPNITTCSTHMEKTTMHMTLLS